MTLESDRLLDDIGWDLLDALQEDARLSYRELGRRVGLSSPAVVERIRRMEEAGIITGYRVELDLSKLGFSIIAFMRIEATPGNFANLADRLKAMPEVLECHRVTGSDDYIAKVAVSSVTHLEALLDRFTESQLTTLIVLSSPVTRRAIHQQALSERRS
ncbi:Lrp/AsnC family transcriptional regulator [Leptolyngbya sp. AN02str]|uniref:Lrp/AsnC family transcriptional regulator n=1 Tax=Leptolyngbya sp. AN02str TaxID=3423363 RepID=UPI003D321572